MKRLFTLFLCLTLALSICPVTAYAAPAWPDNVSIEADGGIVMDASTGTVLYGKNIHQPYFPASITKILTALVVIENCSLDEMVTFSHNAVYNVEAGSSSAGLDEGDRLSVRDCLYAMMLKSANEAANALAEHVAGSTEEFAKMMNEKAASLGCQDSNFANPSGLNNEEHVVSAYDMALIGKAALENETFVTIDSTLYYDLPVTKRNPEGARIYPGHKMLKKNLPEYYEGVFGGKTGYTSLAGNTLVTFARRGDRTLIAVILNGHQTHYGDTKTLLDFGFENFQNVPVSQVSSRFFEHNSDMTIAGLPAGDMSALYLEDDSFVTIPVQSSADQVSCSISYDMTASDPPEALAKLEYTYEDGRAIGTTYFMSNTEKLNEQMNPTIPVLESLPAEAPSSESTADKTSSSEAAATKSPEEETEVLAFQIPSFLWKILITILCIGAVLALVISVKIHLNHKEEQERQLRQERRRQRLKDMGISDSEFEKMVEARRSRRRDQ